MISPKQIASTISRILTLLLPLLACLVCLLLCRRVRPYKASQQVLVVTLLQLSALAV
jgi:hypothetical protein